MGRKEVNTKSKTFSLNLKDVERLEWLMQDAGQDRGTHAIRQAIATQVFIRKALNEGSKILIEKPDGTVRYVEFAE